MHFINLLMKHSIFVCDNTLSFCVAIFMFGRVLSVCECLCVGFIIFPIVSMYSVPYFLGLEKSNYIRLNQSVSLHPAFKFKSPFIGTVGTRHHLHLISAVFHVSLALCVSVYFSLNQPPKSLY